MQIKCEYCGSIISDTDTKCPNCGATNKNVKRTGKGAPTTIEELKEWYVGHNLPPEETTRFFIGKDYKEKRAFGIYYDENTKNYVVYKNKDDGTRAIRYEGKDENYAVNELYQKLKSEIANQKERIGKNAANTATTTKRDWSSAKLLAVILAPIIAIMALVTYFSPKKGYYKYDDTTYYHLGSSWYYYDNGWSKSYSTPDELKSNFKDYYVSSDYNDVDGYITDFKNTSYYEDYYSSDDDWDSADTWDSSDTWDSGGTDWDSDW